MGTILQRMRLGNCGKNTKLLALGTGALLQVVDGLRGLPTLDLCDWEKHLRAGVRQRRHLD